MEKTTPIQSQPNLPQASMKPTHDPAPFKTFLNKFTEKEKKQFLNNMTRSLSHIITRHMRKMKEASQKMRESFQKK